MRLFLAVAVLMMAFVAYTEAQEAQEDTFQQRFSRLTDKLAELGRQAAGKVVNAYETVRDSEAVAKSREWAREQVERIQDQFSK